MISIRFALVVGTIVIGSGCTRTEPSRAASAPSTPVQIPAVRAESQTFSSSVAITGTLVSPETVTVKAETTGRVLRISKEEGDAVAAGESILWVDESHERLALLQAESAVQVAEAALDRAKVVQSHSVAEWTRAQHLLASGGITERDYKAAELAERDARAQVSLCNAQLSQAHAQVAVARNMLNESIVKSPIAGELQTKLTAAGAYVEPPTPVFSVVNNARLELESMVAAADLHSIRPGQQVRFSVNTFPLEEFTGRVIEINPAIQADTRSAKVRVRVANQNRKLKTGMFAQGEIVSEVKRQGILLPVSAVYRNNTSSKSAYVYVLASGKAKRREVAVGIERDASLEVTSGLSPGEIVAVEQSIELADGVAATPDIRSN
jgi:membrane fusion protein, multidrug efflux system